MANDDDMRRLMEQLLPHLQTSLVSNTSEIGPQESFVPSGHITEELFRLICAVSGPKLLLAMKRWEDFFVTNFLNALSSPEMYLRYVMFACDIEIALSHDVFDKLIKVFALVITLNIITLDKTGVNFCKLTLDVIMVFYKRVLKKPFYRQGGFKGFKEYLQIEYRSLQRHFEYNSDVPVAKRTSHFGNKLEKLGHMFGNVSCELKNITHEDVTKNIRCHKLVKEVLSTTKINLPYLPSSKDLKVRILAKSENKAARSEKSETMPVDDSKRDTTTHDSKREMMTHNSKRETTTHDSRPGTTGIVMKRSLNYEAIDSMEEKANQSWCDNIVRIVTMYNNSKRSDPADANHQIQKDTSKVLEQLKGTFTSLIQVLDEYDEE